MLTQNQRLCPRHSRLAHPWPLEVPEPVPGVREDQTVDARAGLLHDNVMRWGVHNEFITSS